MIVWVINVVQHGFKELKMLIIDTQDKKAIVYCFFLIIIIIWLQLNRNMQQL